MKFFLKTLKYILPLFLFAVLAVFIVNSFSQEEIKMLDSLQLPSPETEGGISVAEAINGRKSVRNFSDESLGLEDVSQLLWAAGGERLDAVTRPSRTYPSAGGINSLNFYLAAGNVDGLESGVYKYNTLQHSLSKIKEGDPRTFLASAALGQGFIAQAPCSIVISGEPAKVSSRYGERGEKRYMYLEAGHAGQNIYLTVVSRNLATAAVGAFNDDELSEVMSISDSETPLYIYPLGRPGN